MNSKLSKISKLSRFIRTGLMKSNFSIVTASVRILVFQPTYSHAVATVTELSEVLFFQIWKTSCQYYACAYDQIVVKVLTNNELVYKFHKGSIFDLILTIHAGCTKKTALNFTYPFIS